jgi:hypothetical protein
MRQYLAIQAMEGKSLGGNFLGRSGLMPYGSGSMMMAGDQGPQGKVGMLSVLLIQIPIVTDISSHPPSVVPVPEYRIMEAYWTKRNGPNHFLFTRERLHDLLH